jgi:hypothetical protein
MRIALEALPQFPERAIATDPVAMFNVPANPELAPVSVSLPPWLPVAVSVDRLFTVPLDVMSPLIFNDSPLAVFNVEMYTVFAPKSTGALISWATLAKFVMPPFTVSFFPLAAATFAAVDAPVPNVSDATVVSTVTLCLSAWNVLLMKTLFGP